MKKRILLIAAILITAKCSLESSSVESLFHDLNHSREHGTSLIVIFYASTCHHCQKFLKGFVNVIPQLEEAHPKMIFKKANCLEVPNFIVAFDVKYFPYMVYFRKGVPRARMPLFLTDYPKMAKQWIDMMHRKYIKEEKRIKSKKEGKEEEAGGKKRKKIDNGYASLDDLMEDDEKIKGYHEGIHAILKKKVLNNPFKHPAGGDGGKRKKAQEYKVSNSKLDDDVDSGVSSDDDDDYDDDSE